MKRSGICGAFLLVVLVATALPGHEQETMPAQLKNVGIDQHLNEQLPLDAAFKDENGKTVKLGDYLGQKPLVLVLAYYDCPMLCSMVLQGLAAAMRQMSFDAGNQYNVLTVSFNPRETPELAAAAKSRYIKQYGRSGAETGWHFLTGAQPEIDRLTRAVGFHYAWDPVSKQYAHATAVMVATPEGKLARYFYGVEFSPRDLRFALVEASRHKIGSPVDAVLLFCYHYDPAVGKYNLLVTRIVQLAGAVSVVLVALFILMMVRRERRQRQAWAQSVKSTL